VAERPPESAPPPAEPASDAPTDVDAPTDGGTETEASESSPAARKRGSWRELPILVVSALVLAIVIKSFLIQAFFIPSPSMEPTLKPGDRILVCRVCLHFQPIHRGDVLVFSDPHPPAGSGRGVVGGFLHWLGQGVGVAQPENPDYIKRVGALPGETWEIRSGVLYINGRKIDRPFLSPNRDARSFGPQTVPSGMLLMLGDNPLESGDSRLTPAQGGLGYVPIDKVIGKAFAIVWPPSRMGWIH
jgi:signal peptidase I